VIRPVTEVRGERVPIPAGSSTTRLAANTSTCTPSRGPSAGRQLPVTGPVAGGWNRGPAPIGRAWLSRADGITAAAEAARAAEAAGLDGRAS
jgi:hypothetical protein